MTPTSTFGCLKSILYAKSKLLNVKFNFGRKILYLISRLNVKLKFVKSRLYYVYCNIFYFFLPPSAVYDEVERIYSVKRESSKCIFPPSLLRENC